MRKLAIAALALIAAPAFAQDASQRSGYSQALQGVEGTVGQVELTDTPSGVVVHVVITEGALEPGMHALHFHETGDCSDAPEFQAAGGHYNPTGKDHGILSDNGMHAGDMPNFMVVEGADTNIDVFNTRVRFTEGEAPLMDGDGSALMIHSGADDYASQPAGDAGSRIACAPITRE